MRKILCLFFFISIISFRNICLASDWPIYKGNIYFTGNNDEIIVKNNYLKWIYQAPNYLFNPVESDNKLYFADLDKTIYCLDSETGKLIWTFDMKKLSSQFGSASKTSGKIKYPVIQGSYLFLSDSTAIYCIDKLKGTPVWARAGYQEGNSNNFVIDGIYADPIISENNIIGWSSLVSPYRYKLSAYCASDECTVLLIERDRLLEFMKDNPDAGYKVMSIMLEVVGNRFERLRETADEAPFSIVKITVHMGTCGIAAGAREIMKTLLEEIARSGQSRIKVSAGGCIGKCPSEPNITVEIQNEKPVIYQKMDPAKMIRVFNEHLISGRIQDDLLLKGSRL